MGTINPYAQAGWFNPDNQTPFSHQPWTLSSPISPIFGALPPFPSENSPDWIRLTFVSADGDVLDCSVVGARQQIFFEISTESFENKPMATTFAKKDGTVLSRIEWAVTPTVEIEKVLSKRPVCEWITRSPEAKQYRTMIVGGKSYAWIPRSSGIYVRPNPPDQYAKISVTSDNSKALLEITSEAFQAGLFEPCIISTVLLFSSRNIN
ncbi:hypothetical protein GALMADRAFT_59596 [Galerina marginata CBS 339.88]|uniref:Uncharacterized protein n=1 Tax=Galerina marginata (strain CBS 339.88) TaxID=685588 RepID=A0A067TTF7_GALM3|nr:hypothetical protein GALMADRAFT_59596 [Galerina marginata CBS 339.88]